MWTIRFGASQNTGGCLLQASHRVYFLMPGEDRMLFRVEHLEVNLERLEPCGERAIGIIL